ncbi:RAQPRD family integrative conjugative element protein, partial [Pseudomonas aeruginosa]|uniref:integrative conjugative element protein, RAQPRD family n=1 Tax=Pseudomonas aeruginosa TaxID=287 RepID=UPI0031B6DF40
ALAAGTLVAGVGLYASEVDVQGADEPGQRFYFDYSRLAADLQRIRQGLQDYMTPSRAQPRDPSDLSGNYTLRGGPMP